MTNRPPQAVSFLDAPAARAPLTLLAVERTMAELRRGRPVVVRGGGGHAVLALAAEAMTPETLTDLATIAGDAPTLSLTARRASVLGLAESAGKIAIVSGLEELAAEDIAALANPLVQTDLGTSLRDRVTVTVRETPGHDCYSAAVALTKLARLLPSAVTVSLDVAEELVVWANRHDFLSVDTGDVFQYANAASRSLRQVAEASVPIAGADDTKIVAFRPDDGGREHLAIVVGSPPAGTPVLVRLHSECFTGDLLSSLRCDCGDQLQGAMEEIKRVGQGVLLYLAQEGRGIGLVNKLRAYQLQDSGYDTLDANEQLGFDADERVYLPAARMLRLMGYDDIRLMTNNPDKVDALRLSGINVIERVAHAFPSNQHNEFYLQTKAARAGHQL